MHRAHTFTPMSPCIQDSWTYPDFCWQHVCPFVRTPHSRMLCIVTMFSEPGNLYSFGICNSEPWESQHLVCVYKSCTQKPHIDSVPVETTYPCNVHILARCRLCNLLKLMHQEQRRIFLLQLHSPLISIHLLCQRIQEEPGGSLDNLWIKFHKLVLGIFVCICKHTRECV